MFPKLYCNFVKCAVKLLNKWIKYEPKILISFYIIIIVIQKGHFQTNILNYGTNNLHY